MSTLHIDLSHVPALALFAIALACIPLVQGLTEAVKRAMKVNGLIPSPFAVQTLAIALGIVCTEVGAMVKMAVDLPDALVLAILGAGVGFAASGHRNYLTGAEAIVEDLTQTPPEPPVVVPPA